MSYEAWRISFQNSEQAAKSAFDELQELKAQVEQLRRESEIIHVGFTNPSQIYYVVRNKLEGSFFPDTQDGCNIPVYMSATHLRRIDLTNFLTRDEKHQLESALLSSNQTKGE